MAPRKPKVVDITGRIAERSDAAHRKQLSDRMDAAERLVDEVGLPEAILAAGDVLFHAIRRLDKPEMRYRDRPAPRAFDQMDGHISEAISALHEVVSVYLANPGEWFRQYEAETKRARNAKRRAARATKNKPAPGEPTSLSPRGRR